MSLDRKTLRHALEALRELARQRCNKRNCGSVCKCGPCHARAALTRVEGSWESLELTRASVRKGARSVGKAAGLIFDKLEKREGKIAKRAAIALVEAAFAQGFEHGAHG